MANSDAVVNRQRATRLIEYLDAVRAIREQPVRDVAEYREKRWWAGDIPVHPSCVVTPDGAEPWLRVDKAQVPPPPRLPMGLQDYLGTGFSNPAREPALRADLDEYLAADPGKIARMRALHRDYVENAWRSWAAAARAAQRARALYDDLFELRTRLQRESAVLELVWGHGILSWDAGGIRIVHPLVTTGVQLAFDADSGAISVEPEALAVQSLEIDLLQGLQLPGYSLLVDAREKFRSEPVGPFASETRDLYQRVLAPLGQDGRIADALSPSPPGAAPVVTATWILMVRRRSTMYRRFFGGLRDALFSGQFDVPAPLAAIVASEPSQVTSRAGAPEAAQSWRRAAERLLMPLPANPEQEAVARQITENHGVTVQGPPGTGKTHTIANLISHLVGHGKRVLVTSQKEQALMVLRDKIPEEIRDLSVAVLGSSASSIGQLDQSVRAIAENSAELNKPAARRRVAELDASLTQVQRGIGALRTRISASIGREQDAYTAGGTEHTPSTLGQWLAATEKELSYVPDAIAPGTVCPLHSAELADLFQITRDVTPADRAEALTLLPEAAELPTGARLASSATELREVRDQLAGTEAAIADRAALERLSPDALTHLTAAVERAADQLAQLEQPWLAAIRGELRSPVYAPVWQEQRRLITEAIAELAAWRSQILGYVISLPDGGRMPSKELLDQLVQLRDRLAVGKGVHRLLQRTLYDVREGCLIDEEHPRNAQDVELCITEARSRRRRYELLRRWNDVVVRVGGPLLDEGTRYPEYDIAPHAEALGTAFTWEQGEWGQLRATLRAAGVRTPETPTSAGLAALAEGLRIAALHVREKELASFLDAVRKYLADSQDKPRASGLWRALSSALDAHAWDRWEDTVAEVRRVSALTGDAVRFDALVQRLTTVAPEWAGRIRNCAGEENVTGAPGTAERAWEWRQAETWLRAITAGDDPASLQAQLEARLREASRVTAELAAESAWLRVAERLTDGERMALTAWVQALQKVGKGLGKYAPYYRAQAQQAMRSAQSAVPVWIMPAHRVVESFDAATTRFDVVIVDESSQCDLFALAALAIADKAIIVGDDKQISPSVIGTDQGAVQQLIREYIADIPHSGMLDITSSLYDLAKMRFPGATMLKEHFRCLPEIIEFSNQLSYGGAILPLREDPADPGWRSVLDVRIEDGSRDPGTDVNEAEAEYIANTIAGLCGDERYGGKTFGVVSMLGDGQAARIEQLLIERLGEKEFDRRQVKCGNAYHFQGDERDVIFVSLVAATGEGRRVGAMTSKAHRQRMNVAASRARDQLWCVRSIGLEELNADDVRAQFIRYCQDPRHVNEAVADVDEKFDSEFERDVFRRLTARGYRVRPQYRVGRYRIDLVVEGRRGRLAVELDGDAYHGPDRWDADRQRQAILERLGWTFYRIRGSAYYRDPDAALAPLWARLDSLGIRPVDQDPVSPPPASRPASPPFPATPAQESTATRTKWKTRRLPAIGNALIEDIASTIVEIVAAEGPVSSDRVFAIYVNASGNRFPSSGDRSRLEEATNFAIDTGSLIQLDSSRDVFPKTLRAAPSPGKAQAAVTRKRRLPFLKPYKEWTARRIPRVRAVTAPELTRTLTAIVRAEGPVTTGRVCDLLARAAGEAELTDREQTWVHTVIDKAIRERVLQEHEADGLFPKTLFLPGKESVTPRERGTRDVTHVPSSELISVAQLILSEDHDITDAEFSRLLGETYDVLNPVKKEQMLFDAVIKAARGI